MTAPELGDDSPPFVLGAIAGISAWTLGYVFTFLLVAPEIDGSLLQEIIQAVDGDPATHEMVGWVFYNAHFVDTVVRDVPIVGTGTTNFIGGEDGFTLLLYLIPIAVLFAIGLAVGRAAHPETPGRGLLAGLTVLPGYLLLSVGGVFLFEVDAVGITAGPDFLGAILLAGILYPAVFGGAGEIAGPTEEIGDHPGGGL